MEDETVAKIMSIETLAADIISRLPAMKEDCAENNTDLIRGLIQSEVAAQQARLDEFDRTMKTLTSFADLHDKHLKVEPDHEAPLYERLSAQFCGLLRAYIKCREEKQALKDALRYTAYQRLPLGNTVIETLPEHWQDKVARLLA